MTRELRVGALFTVGVVLLGIMLSRLARENGVSGGTKTYYSDVADSIGLSQGTAIRLAGISVGRLRDKALEGSKARLTLEIASKVTLHRDARITLKSVGYLGDRYLDLIPGSENQSALKEGSFIPAESGATIEGLMSQGSQLLDVWTSAGRGFARLFGGG